MANTGDTFVITIKETHIKWGTYRYTDSRDPIYGETYLPIPTQYAERFHLYNSNYTKHQDVLGLNLFKYTAYVGSEIFSTGMLKSQGAKQAGAIYAKNLSGYNNLKSLSPWICAADINVGDRVRITFISSDELELHKV